MTSASVVVPSRGGASRLPVLFRALEAQTLTDFEIILVADGDIDGTTEMCRTWSSRLPIRVITFPENRGRSVALNEGFSSARGEVLIRCDDDLEPAPNFVASHVACHDSVRPAGAIGLYRNVFPDNPYTRAYARKRDDMFRGEAYRTNQRETWRYWAGNVSVTRAVWQLVGPYDTAYRAYGFEDVDWGFRLHKLGLPINIRPELETVHHSPATSTRIRARRAFHSGAARNTFERLHGGDALGDDPVKSLWGRATDQLGRRLGLQGVDRLARLTDWSVERLPMSVSEKMIAFSVESAAVAGRGHPDTLDLSV